MNIRPPAAFLADHPQARAPQRQPSNRATHNKACTMFRTRGDSACA